MYNKNRHSSEIVYLEYDNQYLYGEVIQVIEEKEICWVRPLLLTVNLGDLTEEQTIIDLRFTSDLLLPEQLFQPALDVDFITLFAKLEPENYGQENLSQSHQQLQLFMHKLLTAK